MNDTKLNVLYCDDIRHEVGGKVSLIGIYGTHLLVNTIPSTIPRLSVHFSITFSDIELLNEVTIKLTKNGTTLYSSDIKIPETPLVKEGEELESRLLVGGFELLNIEITEQSKLEFFLEMNGQSIKGQKLQILEHAEFSKNQENS